MALAVAAGQREALVHCTCTRPFSPTRPPPSAPPLDRFEHHSLRDLLFCEDCDAVRCNHCAANEVACYYCPTCLFEVPSASVRAEHTRCARNCFQCPHCDHALSVVASDPDAAIPSTSAAASVGVPPYLLACTVCGWDSEQVGLHFDKPTGLAAQLQKAEEPTADLLEFDRLKDQFDPFLRRAQAELGGAGASASSGTGTGRLFQDVPGLAARYGLSSSVSGRSKHAADARTAVDELPAYSSLYRSRGGGGAGSKRPAPPQETVAIAEADLLAAMREMTDAETVASLDRRWTASWRPPVLAQDLRPLRTPLQAKLSKRCPECLHILIKPEQKSSSTRFKIKLVAANYLPQISLVRRPPASIGSRLSAIGSASLRRRGAGGSSRLGDSAADAAAAEEPLRPGRTYTFEVSFVNPLYEPIRVRLAVARPSAPQQQQSKPNVEQDLGEAVPPVLPPPFAVHLPSPTFPIAAYAEDWEFDEAEEDEELLAEEAEDGPGSGSGSGPDGSGGAAAGTDGRASPSKRRQGRHGAGIVERRMNRTTIAMEVAVARDAVGPLQASMLVTYVYQADEAGSGGGVPPPPSSPTRSAAKSGPGSDLKSFSFWTLLPLGTVVPRSTTESRRAPSGAVSGSA